MKAVPAPRELCVALALAAAAGVPVSVHAETLQEAWQLALAHNQTLAAVHADVAAAERNERRGPWRTLAERGCERGYARLNASPTLDVATAGGTLQSGPIFKDNQYVAGSVQMRLPLYSGGQISAGIAAAP